MTRSLGIKPATHQYVQSNFSRHWFQPSTSFFSFLHPFESFQTKRLRHLPAFHRVFQPLALLELANYTVSQNLLPSMQKSNQFAIPHNSMRKTITLYACPVYHNGLPSYLSDDLEVVQKRGKRIFHPELCYEQALARSDLCSIMTARQEI